jgi:hypothetical protein
MQLRVESDRYSFLVKTWESNKGALGFMSWSIWVWVSETETWYKLDGSHRDYPLHPNNAKRTARTHLDKAIAGGYDEYIRTKIYGEEVEDN